MNKQHTSWVIVKEMFVFETVSRAHVERGPDERVTGKIRASYGVCFVWYVTKKRPRYIESALYICYIFQELI